MIHFVNDRILIVIIVKASSEYELSPWVMSAELPIKNLDINDK